MIRKLRLCIHQPYDAAHGKCWACRNPWPCATYKEACRAH